MLLNLLIIVSYNVSMNCIQGIFEKSLPSVDLITKGFKRFEVEVVETVDLCVLQAAEVSVVMVALITVPFMRQLFSAE